MPSRSNAERERRRMGSTRPHVDPATRQRLEARYGSEVNAWFDELPGLLTDLAKR